MFVMAFFLALILLRAFYTKKSHSTFILSSFVDYATGDSFLFIYFIITIPPFKKKALHSTW